MKYRTHYDIEYLLTIFSANHYYYQAQFVGVISKRNRGPVFLRHSVEKWQILKDSNILDYLQLSGYSRPMLKPFRSVLLFLFEKKDVACSQAGCMLQQLSLYRPTLRLYRVAPKKRDHSVIQLLTSEILLRSTRFIAEIKVVSFSTRKHKLLKLIMCNSGATWRIRVIVLQIAIGNSS